MAQSRDAIEERIEQLLRENGWTPYELSKRAGLSDSHVGLILKRGTARTARKTLEQIAAGAGVSPRWLLEGEGPPDATVREPRLEDDDGDPRMRNREGFDRNLIPAMALRPNHPRYVWDAVGAGDPLLTVPLTPALLADLADVLAKYLPAPPGHTQSRRS